MKKSGVFCEVFGNTIRNRILEYILEMNDLDFAVGDMSKELEISKPKCYEIISEFENSEYIKKTRMVGKTQLYILNKDNSRVKLFIKSFKECMKLVAEEQEQILVLNEKKEKYNQKKKDLQFLKKFRKDSTMTGEDAVRLGREVNKKVSRRYVRK